MSSSDMPIPDADGWQTLSAVASVPSRNDQGVGRRHEEVKPPTYRVSAYTVFPSGFDRISHPHKHRWCVTVADAGDGWAIRRGNMNLSIQREWEFEPPAGLRDAAFLRRCRFNEHAALLRARRVIDKLTVQELTFDEFVAEIREHSAQLAKQHLEQESGVSLLRKILDWHTAGKPEIQSNLDLTANFEAPHTRPRRRLGRRPPAEPQQT